MTLLKQGFYHFLLSLLVFSVTAFKQDIIFQPNCTKPCEGIQNSTDGYQYLCGNHRLGPVNLPSLFPVSIGLETYPRFGTLCPKEFYEKWIDKEGHYRFPNHETHGFAIGADMKRIASLVILNVGRKLDRFGKPSGAFLSPIGSPYIERALPPSSLNPGDSKFPYNYHVYQVLKPFPVLAGPVRSWFEQPGMGTQFFVNIAANGGERNVTKDGSVSIQVLLDQNYISELVDETDFDDEIEYAFNKTAVLTTITQTPTGTFSKPTQTMTPAV